LKTVPHLSQENFFLENHQNKCDFVWVSFFQFCRVVICRMFFVHEMQGLQLSHILLNWLFCQLSAPNSSTLKIRFLFCCFLKRISLLKKLVSDSTVIDWMFWMYWKDWRTRITVSQITNCE
jgi:hypothetical protein